MNRTYGSCFAFDGPKLGKLGKSPITIVDDDGKSRNGRPL